MAAHIFKINGFDALQKFGLMFLEGVYSELLKIPAIKQGIEVNWPDQHGTDRDTSAAYLQSNEMSLKVIIRGNNQADYVAKYAAFVSLYTTPGYFTLDALYLNRRYRLLSREISDPVMFDNKTMSFTWVVVDDTPATITAIPTT